MKRVGIVGTNPRFLREVGDLLAVMAILLFAVRD
jgi:hypothetical protein